MKMVDTGKYFRILPEDDVDVNMLLGVRQKKDDRWLQVENNVVNRIVLGLYKPPTINPGLQHAEGLKEYQRHDVAKMISGTSILNANPMGLGKTVEAIIAMRELGVQNALIIVPKSILLQWQDQIAYWWPQMHDRVNVLPSTYPRNCIALINYEKLLNQQTLTKLKGFKWDVIICDEAHRIKNHKSKRTMAVKSIPSTYRWALTGTPILNKPDDLWSLLHFLDQQYSGNSYWNFVNYFCEIEEGFWGRKILGLTDDPAKVAVLNHMLSSMSIRNYIQVASGKTQSTVRVPMGPKQKALYKNVKELVLDSLPEGLTIANGAVQTLRLQQVTSWPGLFEAKVHGAKFEWIRDLLEDNPEEKIVVFARFEKSAKALKSFLNDLKFRAEVYTGKQDIEQKNASLNAFIEDPNCRALIGTIGALGQGVDGLQKASRTVVFLDRDWSPELMNQAEDRLNRMGQPYPVAVYYLECAKSFDQYVGKINASKIEDIRRALSSEE